MKKLSFIFLLLFGVFLTGAKAQITIAPTMVFIDQQERFGSFLVLNGSDQAQEVSIDFPFGYPTTNNEGNVEMVYDDSSRAQQYGISNLVKGFPQNFVLQPGQRQTVRMTIRPKDFSDGTYWTRIKTTSSAQNPAVGEETEDGITAQITYKFEQVTTLFYKHGDTNTGIKIQEFSHQNSEDNFEFIADVNRSGNSPFLGSIILTISDNDGNTVVEKRTSTSIYFNYRQVFEVARDELQNGEYTAEITFETQRPDVPSENIVQMEPVSQSISFTKK
jgi:hypothetical protein